MKTALVAVVGLLAFIGGTFAISQADAYRGDPAVEGPNYSEERHQAMEEAFETNNYESWNQLMENNHGRMKEVVNEENFSKFAEAHRLAEEGKDDEARQVRQELGLGMRMHTEGRYGQGCRGNQ